MGIVSVHGVAKGGKDWEMDWGKREGEKGGRRTDRDRCLGRITRG